MRPNGKSTKFLAVLAACAMVSVMFGTQVSAVQAKTTIKIAARGFTEELIAGNLYSELLSAHGFATTLDTSFTDESTIFSALKAGSEELVPDYLGNGLVDLGRKFHPGTSNKAVFNSINRTFAKKHWGVKLLSPAWKFNDQNVFVTTGHNSMKWHLTTLSDLAAKSKSLTFEVMQECSTRSDCLPTFNTVYKPHGWKKIADPVDGTTPKNPPFYGDLLSGKFDVVQGYGTTDAQIAHFHLVALKDNKQMFPPDQMTPFISSMVAHANPGIATWLKKLDATLTTANVSAMNAEVAFGGKLPSKVAHEYLKANGLL